ncbi:MAG TPA: HigA family addiction module antitoxin [Rhizomicrobium sp.]|jgi:addiction module HigA family antidote|nr:HigA family addiction module antitoxin [Rhizomicrobium sp.]
MPRNRLLKGLRPMHPGEHLREDILPALGKSKAEIVAGLLGISRQTLYEVLSENQPVTANLAIRLGKLLGDGQDIWLRMQQIQDCEAAESEPRDVIARVPTLHAAE